LRRARDYLESAYDRTVTVAELAKVADAQLVSLPAGLPAASLASPPHAFQNQLRVGRAREMILRGKPIAQAAVDAGFVDQSHLTRWFKRLLGAPPGRVKPFGTNRHSAS